MKCSYVKAGEFSAIVCSSGRTRNSPKCVKCGRLAMRECDWKLGNGKTCDAFVCRLCSYAPAPGKDLCPEHAALWANHPRNPKNEANAAQAKDQTQIETAGSAGGDQGALEAGG